ncbi:MAG: glycosyltransferase family 2 protein [Patescibacteria group bacterium]|nr:glycosyltransferase family 2 protein [Patescibacteria group bacterium]
MPKHLFFSIVIPAHNEARYLSETLTHLCDLEYPKSSYEVIVVENGSTDRTLEIARSFACDNLKVMTSHKGVSRARNAGFDAVSPKSDWTIFLDADTSCEPPFLMDLNEYLSDPKRAKAVVGTVELQPRGNTRWYAKAWFAFYNLGHRLTRTCMSVIVAKSALRDYPHHHFDEYLSFAEDLKFVRTSLKHGKFFFFWTKTVWASTRRFDQVGWVKLFFIWNWEALVLSHTRHKRDPYEVVR